MGDRAADDEDPQADQPDGQVVPPRRGLGSDGGHDPSPPGHDTPRAAQVEVELVAHVADEGGARLERQRLIGLEQRGRVGVAVELEPVGDATAGEPVAAREPQARPGLLRALEAADAGLVARDGNGPAQPAPIGRAELDAHRVGSGPSPSRARTVVRPLDRRGPSPTLHPAGRFARHGTSDADGTDWAITTITSLVPHLGAALDRQVVGRAAGC